MNIIVVPEQVGRERHGRAVARENPLRPTRTQDAAALAALGCGALIPVIYYGVQILCASYNPGYSFVRQVASELGSARSARHTLFNLGFAVQGVLTLIASYGFARATLRLGVNPTLSLLLVLALATNGVQMIWAAYFPLPHPRHAGQPPFLIASTLLPILLTATVWRGSGPNLKAYFIATLMLLVVTIVILPNQVAINTASIRGLIQRIHTLTTFPPIAVAALALAHRYSTATSAPPKIATPEPDASARGFRDG